ncbi:EscV/YscV/HrcV family type III secretion system export apparatus protein [Salmonella enterica]|nr:EscV/YscV/HrcV family type III secretion system export apparatus protein [Salmonella enterica]EBT7486362.1 EscV/YscV/HrcV family type III secretion system export apparatus protein [Salmonella enterica]EFV4530996.1 EscV/YscV/HrcV family type III secretion system export apparatus protein [Salmonella enterica]EHF3428179.1 EscV/YscV/HrcV family type III secretion system export apparatus protein [Salmonella enterica]EKS7036929.1 type III secretion system export apparatus subunit SctV [Salmonella 
MLLMPRLKLSKSGINESFLAVSFFFAILIMIIPLPTILVDVIIGVNISFSIFLLLLSMTLKSPLDLSVFPTILLATTLLRLSLSISTTKLILLEQNAGDIILSFGSFVVGGNIIVGMVIFFIITIVQFLVITKGSERVAEVGARFTLDGMPGKQMSIDGDMRAGVIDATEAKKLREQVQKESQMYGAMDGSMKFVKGDAIAGLIIVFINLFGGVLIGILQYDMEFSEAIKKFSILTVGDALVAQIPALIISVTAALIVTRVPSDVEHNLSSDVARQLSSNANPVFTCAFLVIIMALIPGFPTLTFLIISGVLTFFAFKLRQKEKTINKKLAGEDKLQFLSPLILKVHHSYVDDNLKNSMNKIHSKYFTEYGIPLPEIKIVETREEEGRGEVSLLLYSEPVLTIHPGVSTNYIIESPNTAIPGSVLTEEITNKKMVFYGDFRSCNESMTIITSETELIELCINEILQQNLKDFIGIQETKYLIDLIQCRYDELIREVLRHLSISKITDILQRLVEEDISIRDLRAILEALILWGPKEKDPIILCEYTRVALRRHIISKYTDKNKSISVIVFDSHVENEIRESIRQTSSGSYLNLSDERISIILNQINTYCCNHGNEITAIITTLDIRRYVKKMISDLKVDLPVVSFQEMGGDLIINVKGTVRYVE